MAETRGKTRSLYYNESTCLYMQWLVISYNKFELFATRVKSEETKI